jgi:hypothetical protein
MAAAFGALTISRLAKFRLSKIRRGPLQPLKRRGFLFSHEELATIFHPATASVRAGRMATMDFAELEPPTDLPSGENDDEVLLGQVKYKADRRLAGLKYHVGETPAWYKTRPKPDDGRMGYQWPASRTADDMAMLHEIRTETERPINPLLHEAVELMYEMFRNEE